MRCLREDIWLIYNNGWNIVIPTNQEIDKFGRAVMGRGLALQSKRLFKNLDKGFAQLIKKHGNQVFYIERLRLILFPTKSFWKDPASIELITKSCQQLKGLLEKRPDLKIAMPKIGCGNGRLNWREVAPIVTAHFGDRPSDKFMIIDNEQGDSTLWLGSNNQKKDGKAEEDAEKPLVIEANPKTLETKEYNFEQLLEKEEQEKDEKKDKKSFGF